MFEPEPPPSEGMWRETLAHLRWAPGLLLILVIASLIVAGAIDLFTKGPTP